MQIVDTDIRVVGLAVGIALLIGMERERTRQSVGVRSFVLVAILGCAITLLTASPHWWLIGAGLLAIAAMLVAHTLRLDVGSSGTTTIFAVLVVYVIAVMLAIDETALALVISGTVFLLLRWKQPLHSFAGRLEERDVAAVTTLALISLVVLPVLPNESMGWYGAFNPFQTWLMVVLIVAINLAGYVCQKVFGERGGTLLSGLLGGAVSSTATTLSIASKAKAGTIGSHAAAAVILIASAVVYARMMLEVAVVAPGLLLPLALPAMIHGALLLILGLILIRRLGGSAEVAVDDIKNPANLGAAVVFGVLYTLISLAVAWAKDALGQGGLFGVALLSGLTDVDAITLSTAQLYQSAKIDSTAAWQVIFVAGLANLSFKTGAACVLGGAALARQLWLPSACALAAGAGLVLAWP